MKKIMVVLCGIVILASTILSMNPIMGLDSGNEIIRIISPDNDSEVSGIVAIEVEVMACFCEGKTSLYVDNKFISEAARSHMSDDGNYEVFLHQWDTTEAADGVHQIRVYDKHDEHYDEISLVVVNSGGDSEEPKMVQIISPEDKAEVKGDVTVTAEVPACFCKGTTSLYVDNVFITEGTPGRMTVDGAYQIFIHVWDSTKATDGEHKIRVYDKHNDFSYEITVMVNNDGGSSEEPDVIRIVIPEDNAVVKGDVTITAEVLACFCNSTTSLYVDNQFITDGTPGRMSENSDYQIFIHAWDSREASNGGHKITVFGKHGEHSDSITVFVNNEGSGKPQENIRIVSPQNDDKIGGKIIFKVEVSSSENPGTPRMFVNDQFVSEGLLLTEIEYDGESYNIFTLEWDTSEIENGEYSVRIQDDQNGEYDEIQLNIENMGVNTDDGNDSEVASNGTLLLLSLLSFGIIICMITLFIILRKK